MPLVLPDGRWLVVDERPPYIHVLSATGDPISAFVEAGEGPGHAVAPAGVGYLAGRVWLWDAATQRMSYFDLQGRLRREVPLRVTGMVFPLDANRFVYVPNTYYGVAGDSVKQVTLGILDSTGRSLGTIYRYIHRAGQLSIPRAGGRAQIGSQPYDRGAYNIYVPFGNGLAVGFPSVVRRDGGTAFRLVRLNGNGRPLFDSWVQIPGVPVTASHVENAVQSLRAGPDSADPALPGRIRRALVVPAFMPAFSVGFAGEQGETWFREFGLGRGGRVWFVVSATGRVIGRFTLPEGQQAIALAPGGLISSGEDSQGEPTLTRYRVVRTP